MEEDAPLAPMERAFSREVVSVRPDGARGPACLVAVALGLVVAVAAAVALGAVVAVAEAAGVGVAVPVADAAVLVAVRVAVPVAVLAAVVWVGEAEADGEVAVEEGVVGAVVAVAVAGTAVGVEEVDVEEGGIWESGRASVVNWLSGGAPPIMSSALKINRKVTSTWRR